MKGERKERKERTEGTERTERKERTEETAGKEKVPSSVYLIACDETGEEAKRSLLYETLAPVFFGRKAAGTYQELDELFQEQYGIDVLRDFVEGDEHYEEYREAQQAIAEGLSIYGGSIAFDDGMLAKLAEQVWTRTEQAEYGRFKRINTMLEE